MSSGYLQLSTTPVDPTVPHPSSWLAGKNILTTGTSASLGAAIVRHWASLGANVTMGSVNPNLGPALVAELRQQYPEQTFHWQRCDVRKWEDQAALFEFADRVTGAAGIHVVFPNAGVVTEADCQAFELPDFPEGVAPTEPSLHTLDVNVKGTMYSTYLALTYLGNARNARRIANKTRKESDSVILLMSSILGVVPAPALSLYGSTKHAVVGLWRSIRVVAANAHGVRLNMVCPYFVESTGLISLNNERMICASSPGLAELPDVVDAATILVGDPSIVGRALVISPKVEARFSAEGEFEPLQKKDTDVFRVGAIWDGWVDDEKMHSLIMLRMMEMLTRLTVTRSWWRWFQQIFYVGGNLEYRDA